MKKQIKIRIGNRELTTDELHEEIRKNADKVSGSVRDVDGNPKDCNNNDGTCESCQL